MIEESCDVLVAGAGLGGLSVAALLAKDEVRKVLVVERGTGAGHPGFAEALEWALFPAIDGVTSVQPTPEQAWDGMLDPQCRGIEGLYFVGDPVKN